MLIGLRVVGAAAALVFALACGDGVIVVEDAADREPAGSQRATQTGDAAHDFDANRDCVAAVGAAYGLDRADSIAFWMRATFSRFEPAGGM